MPKENVQVEGNKPLTVKDLISWLDVLEPSQIVLNRDDKTFSCLSEFKFVSAVQGQDSNGND